MSFHSLGGLRRPTAAVLDDGGDFSVPPAALTAEAEIELDDERRIAAALPGETVIISQPLTVNVFISTAKRPHSGYYKDVALPTAVPGGAVLPIGITKSGVTYKHLVPGAGKIAFGLSMHMVESGIAATYYKAQGRTMERVLACLNKTPQMPYHSFAAIFVFISRVKFGRHCRVFPLHPGGDWTHLADLHPPDNLVVFLGGYNAEGIWDVALARKTLATLASLTPSKRKKRRSAPVSSGRATKRARRK